MYQLRRILQLHQQGYSKRRIAAVLAIAPTTVEQYLRTIEAHFSDLSEALSWQDDQFVIGQTKTVCNLEHSRHRSACNSFVNVYAALIAYSFYERKPVATVDLSDRLLQTGEPTWALAA